MNHKCHRSLRCMQHQALHIFPRALYHYLSSSLPPLHRSVFFRHAFRWPRKGCYAKCGLAQRPHLPQRVHGGLKISLPLVVSSLDANTRDVIFAYTLC